MQTNIKEKMASALSLPKEIVLDLPTVTIIGFQDIRVENYKNILEFTDDTIRLSTKKGNLTITGQNLTLKEVTTELIIITGRIIACTMD